MWKISRNYIREWTQCNLKFNAKSLSKLRPYWRVTSRSELESLTSQNCKVLRIRSWKEARRARRPFRSLRTCRVTAQKLLNKRFVLTYGTKLAVLHIPTYLYTHTYTRAYVYTHAYAPACIRAEQRRYIGSDPAHSALMNMLEHGGSTLPNRPASPPSTPVNLASATLYRERGDRPAAGYGERLRESPCLYRTIFDDSVARHASVSTDCRFMNKVDARASVRAVCGFTISRSRSYSCKLADNRRCEKR